MNDNSAKMTPMMKQYFDIKKKYSREILFFRMGDFYEMFFEDAQTASGILDIALTARQNDVPMCGIPFHAAESYIARLVKAGKNVAICEQLEKVPSSGTIVKRDVIRIITPGTVVEQNLLPSDDNNFLCSAVLREKKIGLAFVDISTGDFHVKIIEKSLDSFRSEIARYRPGEVIFRSDMPDDHGFISFLEHSGYPINHLQSWFYDQDYLQGVITETFHIQGLSGLGMKDPLEVEAAGSVLQYLKETQKQAVEFLKFPRIITQSRVMHLDEATIKNLELTVNNQNLSKERTLFSTLNRTKTAMGRRLLERSILEPLLDEKEVNRRLDSVQLFTEHSSFTEELRELLENIKDIERMVSRFNLGRAFPRNFIALSQSLQAAKGVKELIAAQPWDVIQDLGDAIPSLSSLTEEIDNAICSDPALSPEQGQVIRKDYSDELTRLHKIKTHGKEWILSYQEEEKKRLDIPTLRVKYNKILGYYIEVSKGQSEKVPEEYLRKQTLVGSERYTTEKLQEFERDILTASDTIIEIERGVIDSLTEKVNGLREKIQETASAVASLDFLQSLATTALEHNYTRPVIDSSLDITVEEGRHPVVEHYFTSEVFIPNNIHLDSDESIIKIITGPNMSGKSTYIRMAALIQLLAQVGSFVPARNARCGIVDRIFTRIGASDNLSRGESTFLVEMNETAAILNNATEKSLVIMDEVGRGTSTYDGLSIAWAIVEYILRYLKAKTLFATHYHELTELGKKKGIENYTVMVKETVKGIEFMHKVVKGSADRSYGIHVARLAGIPRQIINRADKLLVKLENGLPQEIPVDDNDTDEQLEIFNAVNHRLIQALEQINVEKLTPIEALNEIDKLKKIITS